MCLSACINQVRLSLPGTFDLVQPGQKLDPLPYVKCECVCLSGYGNYIGGDYIGGDYIGGDYIGGDYIGRDYIGGDFRGGDFRGGDYRGTD